jgi:hypothetical protein
MVVYHAGLARCIQIMVRLGLFLADMPQRNEACCQKNHQAGRPCHMCFIHHHQLAETNVPVLKRTSAISKQLFDIMAEQSQPSEISRLEAVTGQKFMLVCALHKVLLLVSNCAYRTPSGSSVTLISTCKHLQICFIWKSLAH